ncbi:hypothetical protein [Paenibacillus koleovorans]|nr:hypothetical protein [Paenibacillus koleovorans]
MAVRKEDSKAAQEALARKEQILRIVDKACKENDSALRRLSKN